MKKQIRNNNPTLKIISSSLVDLPTPSSISVMWNMGFLLATVLSIQIATGVLLSMHFIPHADWAFSSTSHTMRDIIGGWGSRFIHTNAASLLFTLLFIHIGRGVFFKSSAKKTTAWMTGTSLLLVFMATAFLGYVLPWGQMSFWGATVITNIFSAIPHIGKQVVTWLWGNFSVSQPTLNRFFSLHFLAPLLGAAIAVMHLATLHTTGSSNPTGSQENLEKVKFHPLLTTKDSTPAIVTTAILLLMVANHPDTLGDVENMNKANPMKTPVHIQPEWYFLFAYAILRSVPSKLGGVVALIISILILLAMVKPPHHHKPSPSHKAKFWSLTGIFTSLTWIGANPVEPPYEMTGQVLSTLYFMTTTQM